MTIHHATVKKAAKAGIILTEIDNARGTVAQALNTVFNIRFTHPDAKQAVAAVELACVFRSEWPNLELIWAGGANKWIVEGRNSDGEIVTVIDSETVPTIGEVIAATHDVDVDPEEGYEEEVHSVVVPERYKQEYAARGNRDNCGDWIAKKLEGLFETQGGNFDADLFADFLTLNGVALVGKWADLPNSGQRGWAGRYRMNGRQKLELRIAETGVLKYASGDEIQEYHPPLAYLEFLVAKHPKVTPTWTAPGK